MFLMCLRLKKTTPYAEFSFIVTEDKLLSAVNLGMLAEVHQRTSKKDLNIMEHCQRRPTGVYM